MCLYRQLLSYYKERVEAGYYEALRPLTIREALNRLSQKLDQMARGEIPATSASAALAPTEQQRAFGNISADEERRQHQRQAEVTDGATTLAGKGWAVLGSQLH